MSIIKYTDLFMYYDKEIANIKIDKQSSNFTFFKVRLKNGKDVTCGPIENNSKEYIYMLKLRNNIIADYKKKHTKLIKTKNGTIRVYDNKKKKTKLFNKERLIAIGLATAIGFSTAAILSKNDIGIKDVMDATIGNMLDGFEAARIKGTLTDEEFDIFGGKFQDHTLNFLAL